MRKNVGGLILLWRSYCHFVFSHATALQYLHNEVLKLVCFKSANQVPLLAANFYLLLYTQAKSRCGLLTSSAHPTGLVLSF